MNNNSENNNNNNRHGSFALNADADDEQGGWTPYLLCVCACVCATEATSAANTTTAAPASTTTTGGKHTAVIIINEINNSKRGGGTPRAGRSEKRTDHDTTETERATQPDDDPGSPATWHSILRWFRRVVRWMVMMMMMIGPVREGEGEGAHRTDAHDLRVPPSV
jgi:hypothetical protein